MIRDIELERGLPASPDAERAVLGSILLDNLKFAEAASLLQPEDFALTAHQRVYRRMGQMIQGGSVADLVTVSEELNRNKELESVGGVAWLASLTEQLPRRLAVTPYAEIVLEKSRLRQVIEVCQKAITRAADQSEDATAVISDANAEILAVMARNGEESLKDASERAYEAINRFTEASIFLPSGISELDRLYGGYAMGEMTVFGGRPQQGKTSAVIQALALNCSNGTPCDFYSQEMRKERVFPRFWSVAGDIPFFVLRHPEEMTEDHRRNLAWAKKRVESWPLYLTDRRMTADEICAAIRLGKMRRGTKLAVIDYLQKMKFPGKLSDRFAAVTDASAKLAAVANETGVAVLLISSLTTKNGKHRNEPPTLQDLRLSGDIEYDADTAFLIHREVDESTEKVKTKGQIICAKARSDEGGAFNINYDTTHLILE